MARRDQILINYYQQADHEGKQKTTILKLTPLSQSPSTGRKTAMGSPGQRRRRRKKSVEPSPQSQSQIYFLLSSPNLSSPERFSKKGKGTMPFTLLGSGRVVEQQLCQCKKKKNPPSLCPFHRHSIIIKIQSAQPGPHSTAQKKKKPVLLAYFFLLLAFPGRARARSLRILAMLAPALAGAAVVQPPDVGL